MFKVENLTRSTLVAERIEMAESSLRRFWGLLGRRGLAAGGGLWIKPCSGVHTIGMAFAIDVVGLDRDLRVMQTWSSLRPMRMTSVNLRMRSVMELPAGTILAQGIEAGDQFIVARLDDERHAARVDSALAGA